MKLLTTKKTIQIKILLKHTFPLWPFKLETLSKVVDE